MKQRLIVNKFTIPSKSAMVLFLLFLIVSFVSVRVHAGNGLYFSYAPKMTREYSGRLSSAPEGRSDLIGFDRDHSYSDQSNDHTYSFDFGWNSLNVETERPLLCPMLELGVHLESSVQFVFDSSTYTANFSNLFINFGYEFGLIYSYVGLSLPAGLLFDGNFSRVRDRDALNFGIGAQVGVGVFYKNLAWEILAQREYDANRIEDAIASRNTSYRAGADIDLSSLRYGSQLKIMF